MASMILLLFIVLVLVLVSSCRHDKLLVGAFHPGGATAAAAALVVSHETATTTTTATSRRRHPRRLPPHAATAAAAAVWKTKRRHVLLPSSSSSSSFFVLTATQKEGGSGDDAASTSTSASTPFLPDNNDHVPPPPAVESRNENEQTAVAAAAAVTATRSESSQSLQKRRKKKDKRRKQQTKKKKKELELQWCTEEVCTDVVRERTVGEHHQIILCGPATGQVVYRWQEAEAEAAAGSRSSSSSNWQLDDGDDEVDANDNSSHSSKPRRLAAVADDIACDSDDDVADSVDDDDDSDSDDDENEKEEEQALRSVLLLVKPGDERLMKIAASAVRAWTDDEEVQKPQDRIIVLLDPSTAARLKHYHGVDGKRIHLFEDKRRMMNTPGFGSNLRRSSQNKNNKNKNAAAAAAMNSSSARRKKDMDNLDFLFDFDETINPQFLGGTAALSAAESIRVPPQFLHEPIPDLICTLGGDGLLMHAGMLFQGPVPPILCVAGGSLGFLTTFSTDEMIEAVRIALDIRIGPEQQQQDPEKDIHSGHDDDDDHVNGRTSNDLYDYAYNNMHYKPMNDINVYPPNMESYPLPLSSSRSSSSSASSSTPAIDVDATPAIPRFSFGPASGGGDRICLSIRMRLCCCIFNREGVLRARYNVLNEVVIDRGSSPYLAALECFCDDVHLTTVQADGIIFATPTGSTAYSMAAGGSVVHPAVPCILVTPICPHVLSFRSMVFPDHVVLRVYVPDDARAEASVAFDGKHRQELRRGDSVQIKMSAYPIPTINRLDHSSDWLGSLKRNFNFNTRPRQRPL